MKPATLMAVRGYTIQSIIDLRSKRPFLPLAKVAIPSNRITGIATPKSVRSLTEELGLMCPKTMAQPIPITATACVASEPSVFAIPTPTWRILAPSRATMMTKKEPADKTNIGRGPSMNEASTNDTHTIPITPMAIIGK